MMFETEKHTFISLDMVDASHIKSKWQAHFLQVFPLLLDALPVIHESDKKCFEDNWQGSEDITYEEFMEKYYKGWLT